MLFTLAELVARAEFYRWGIIRGRVRLLVLGHNQGANRFPKVYLFPNMWVIELSDADLLALLESGLDVDKPRFGDLSFLPHRRYPSADQAFYATPDLDSQGSPSFFDIDPRKFLPYHGPSFFLLGPVSGALEVVSIGDLKAGGGNEICVSMPSGMHSELLAAGSAFLGEPDRGDE